MTTKLISTFMMFVLFGGALALTACQGGKEPNIEFIQDMMESPAIKAQEYDETSPHHSGMRVPAEGTVPVGFTPYKYGTNVELASKELKNPIANPTDDDLFVGMKMYETNCAICHGHKGEGGEAAKSSIAELMALKPPSLLTDKARAFTDGHLYHIITMGQGVMLPYASHVPQASRWQLVDYIRQLQKKNAGK